MKHEIFTRWESGRNISTRLHCESIHDTGEGLIIVLRDEDSGNRALRILFDAHIAYRNIDESYRLRTWLRLERTGMGGLFHILNSQWMAWLKAEAGGVLDDKELTHYAVFTDADCIEIVSEFHPSVDWLEM